VESTSSDEDIRKLRIQKAQVGAQEPNLRSNACMLQRLCWSG
jgi:hypothetical protein